jgi:ParB/RepB/Spo0J family partition protein
MAPLPGQQELFDRWAWGKKQCRTCPEIEWTITPAGEFQCSDCRKAKGKSVMTKTATTTKKPKAPKKSSVKVAESSGLLLGTPELPEVIDAASSTVESWSAMGTTRDLPIDRIDIIPDRNPRKVFDLDALNELATAIQNDGLLQPVIVRPSEGCDGRWELMAGERRLRACRDILKVQTIWVKIIVADDELQAAITDDENGQRVQLNPIEAAKSLQMRLKASGLNQSAFASKAGMSQGAVSNTLRLLELPAPIRDHVISGEIAPAYARMILPFMDLPAVEADLVERLGKVVTENEGSPLSHSNVFDQMEIATRLLSRPVKGFFWDKDIAKNLSIDLTPQLTPELRRKLDIRECPSFNAEGKELRAFNANAWKEAQAEWAVAEEARRLAERRSPGKGTAGTPQDDDEPTSDENDDASQGSGETGDSQQISALNAAREYQLDLRGCLIRWYQHVIAKWLPDTGPEFQTRLLLHFAQHGGDERCQRELLDEVLQPHGVIVNLDPDADDPELLYSLSDCRPEKLHAVSISLMQRWVQLDIDRWGSSGITMHLLLAMIAELGIDRSEHWTPSEDFLAFQTDVHLAELVKEWKLKKAPAERPKLLQFILDQVGLKVPARVLAIDLNPAKADAKAAS